MSQEDLYAATERANSKLSKFVKIVPGTPRTLEFDPSKFRIVERAFNDKTSEGIEYLVKDETGAEKPLTLSPKWAIQLNELLKAGFRTIRVTRTGQGLDTNYTFVPVKM